MFAGTYSVKYIHVPQWPLEDLTSCLVGWIVATLPKIATNYEIGAIPCMT